VRKLTKEQYKKKIIKILIKFQEDEQMTVQKAANLIIDEIVDIEMPEV